MQRVNRPTARNQCEQSLGEAFPVGRGRGALVQPRHAGYWWGGVGWGGVMASCTPPARGGRGARGKCIPVSRFSCSRPLLNKPPPPPFPNPPEALPVTGLVWRSGSPSPTTTGSGTTSWVVSIHNVAVCDVCIMSALISMTTLCIATALFASTEWNGADQEQPRELIAVPRMSRETRRPCVGGAAHLRPGRTKADRGPAGGCTLGRLKAKDPQVLEPWRRRIGGLAKVRQKFAVGFSLTSDSAMLATTLALTLWTRRARRLSHLTDTAERGVCVCVCVTRA